jgi:hypothetical protein
MRRVNGNLDSAGVHFYGYHVYQDLRDPLIELRERGLCNGLATLFPSDKIALQARAIASGSSTLDKRVYCIFPGTEAATDVVAMSFLYSALAWRSIGISGSASFQVVKKSS